MVRWVTVPEGLSTATQITDLLAREGFGGPECVSLVIEDASLLQSYGLPATGVEGYLFPDTYAFEWGNDARRRGARHARPLSRTERRFAERGWRQG